MQCKMQCKMQYKSAIKESAGALMWNDHRYSAVQHQIHCFYIMFGKKQQIHCFYKMFGKQKHQIHWGAGDALHIQKSTTRCTLQCASQKSSMRNSAHGQAILQAGHLDAVQFSFTSIYHQNFPPELSGDAKYETHHYKHCQGHNGPRVLSLKLDLP